MANVASRNTLVVFVRYPTPGRVKTRLAAGLGAEAAARIYDAFVRDLVGRFSGSPFDVRWDVAPPDLGFADRFGIPPESCRPQRGADLGARMLDAFRTTLVDDGDRCVLIGSDAPHLPVERIEEAFARVSPNDIVLGPSLDGGYYLIAMARPHDVFSDMTWSVDSVREETRRRAAELGLSLVELAPDFDVDETEDLKRLRATLETDSVRCPATQRILIEVARP